MESAPTIDLFCIEPVEHWVSAGSGVVFAPTEEIVGGSLWGSPSPAEGTETLRALDVCKRSRIRPRFSVLMDASRLEGLQGAVEGVVAMWVGREAELLKRVRMMAIVKPTKAQENKLREFGAALGQLPASRVVATLREALKLL